MVGRVGKVVRKQRDLPEQFTQRVRVESESSLLLSRLALSLRSLARPNPAPRPIRHPAPAPRATRMLQRSAIDPIRAISKAFVNSAYSLEWIHSQRQDFGGTVVSSRCRVLLIFLLLVGLHKKFSTASSEALKAPSHEPGAAPAQLLQNDYLNSVFWKVRYESRCMLNLSVDVQPWACISGQCRLHRLYSASRSIPR